VGSEKKDFIFLDRGTVFTLGDYGPYGAKSSGVAKKLGKAIWSPVAKRPEKKKTLRLKRQAWDFIFERGQRKIVKSAERLNSRRGEGKVNSRTNGKEAYAVSEEYGIEILHRLKGG